jgi:membrane protease YdiL (CAAX protease family)
VPQPLQQLLRSVLTLRFRPSADTVVAFGSYLLVVGALYTAFQLFTTAAVAANFITYGPVMMAGLGIGIPAFYTALVRRRPLSDIGITTRLLVPSLILGVLLGAQTYSATVATLHVSWSIDHLPLVALGLAIGLFEAVFFRGWLQLRFEAAFGLLPGLLLGALCYSLYHLGYGMTPGEMAVLFLLGLIFGAAFRLTRNILLLWPFYTPMGGLYTYINDGLTMPLPAALGFAITIALMAALIVAASRLGRLTARHAATDHAAGRAA